MVQKKKKESESVLLEQPLFSIHTVQSGQVTAKWSTGCVLPPAWAQD